MARSERRTRLVRIGFVVLLVVSAAQVTWWIYDQWTYSGRVLDRQQKWRQSIEESHRALRDAGLSEERIAELAPGLAVAEEGIGSDMALRRDRDRRINRYLWEGGFFLVVLVAGIGILARAVREEALLRRRQENFLAAVSHELRSPIASSRVAAETLQLRDPPPAERRRLVGRVIRNLTRLEIMVTNLLDTARLQEGRLELQAEPVRMSDALAPVLAEYRDRAEAGDVQLRAEVDPGARALADPEAVRAVARNLLENAFGAVQDAGVREVQVQVTSAAGRVELVVADTGRGFDPAEGERLFAKFYRPGDELRRGGKGAGLGLYLVRELVERQGGVVRAASPGEGEGAEFRAEWPSAGEHS